jgi:eukaryotic-like serine/threonine-protein kinase
MFARSEVASAQRCPDETALAEFIGGGSTDAEQEAIERHIDACPRCAATVGEYALAFASRTDDGGARPEPDDGPALPSRYRIESCVGFGAGGTVYRAHDRELDRVVALKLLHDGTSDSTAAGGRLAREAKVMAKVVHPNVVTVHDVGIAGERLFIATEFVQGSTLDAWCKEAPRSWRELVDVFVQAGRGLAAIHASGLVHRDFKPHNVMVARDGRVRVTDFGLARLMPELEERERERVQESSPALVLFDDTLASQTRSGALVGTPAYMAPEQLRGERADVRSDQFAYAVALYEALWGVRPFSGKTLTALAHSVCSDPPRPPPSKPRVPRWLLAVVMRGLSQDPGDRFEDMHALLHALTEAPRRRRRRRMTAALTAGFALVAGAGYATAGLTLDVCELDEQRFAGVWDDEVRHSVMQALTRTPEIGRVVVDELDQWLDAWKDTHRQACEAAASEGTSPRQLDLQRACLDRRTSELRAATEVLSQPDDGLSENALDVVATIGAPTRCADIETLETIEPTWASPLGRVLSRQVAGDLDRVEALREAGRLDEARELAERVLARVHDSEHPVRAEALVALGLVQTVARDLDAAEATLHDGIWAAEASGHVEMAARGWLAISKLMVGSRSDLAGGKQADRRASAAVHRLNDPLLELELEANRMGMAYLDGKYDEALERSAELLRRSREVYGDDDPQIGRLLFNMAAAFHRLGRLDEAADHASRCLEIFEARFEGRHPDMVEMFNGLAVIELELGRRQASRSYIERGLALAGELFPEDHRTAMGLIANLAALDMSEDRHAEAVEGYTRVLELQRAATGSALLDIGITLHNLGVATGNAGDGERAIAYFREALDVHLETVGPDHPTTADTLHSLGRALTVAGRHDEAIEHLSRALELRAEGAPRPRAATHFVLARAHDERGETARARTYAERALEILQGSPRADDELLAQIEAWLADRTPT